MRVLGLFTDHPASLGETYAQHRAVALSFAFPLAKAALAAFVHGFFPFLLKRTASDTVRQLHERMIARCAACPGACAGTGQRQADFDDALGAREELGRSRGVMA